MKFIEILNKISRIRKSNFFSFEKFQRKVGSYFLTKFLTFLEAIFSKYRAQLVEILYKILEIRQFLGEGERERGGGILRNYQESR